MMAGVISLCGDSGVCRDCVENKNAIHDFSIQAGKFGGGDSASMIVAGDLFIPLGKFLLGFGGSDAL